MTTTNEVLAAMILTESRTNERRMAEHDGRNPPPQHMEEMLRLIRELNEVSKMGADLIAKGLLDAALSTTRAESGLIDRITALWTDAPAVHVTPVHGVKA